ncbi:Dynein attachment factor N-terminus [Popillia japonica]|uniref:Dynein attachment factor N-terminus n=1 Tax=Popillia japonica TaxID=7064 RepID=A0AAW1JZW9_POPJA
MSKLMKDINNKNLNDMLHNAVEADRLYWLRNEAKIQASYTSRNYDEFRETVAAAHLGPLRHGEAMKKKVIWNSVTQDEDKE